MSKVCYYCVMPSKGICHSVLGRVDVSFPTTSQTLPSCDFQVFVSRYENETSTRPRCTLFLFFGKW
ncbi:MAG: hypothetical protein R3B45_11375 [Bdellovibrionota bacterium]